MMRAWIAYDHGQRDSWLMMSAQVFFYAMSASETAVSQGLVFRRHYACPTQYEFIVAATNGGFRADL